MIKLKFKKTHPDAVLPVANNKEPGTGDTGYDLVAVEDVFIPHQGSAVVPVGLTLADITPGFWLRIEPRSGLGFKHSIQPHLGVIDNGYRGDLAVKLYNLGTSSTTDGLQVKKGDKIAQLVVYELLQPVCEWSDTITESARGTNGFGSSDKPFITRQYDDDWFYTQAFASCCPEGKVPLKVPKIDEGSPDYICVDASETSTDHSTTIFNGVTGVNV